MYMSIMRRFADHSACGNYKATCQPYVSQQRQEPLSGRRKWYVGCSSFTNSPKEDKHFIRWVPENVELLYFQELFTAGLPLNKTSSARCNGQGKMLKFTECGVEFHVIIPDDLDACPYFVIVVFGVHSHAPHAPFVTQGTTVDTVLAMLHPMLTPKTSRSDFLKSPQLNAYLQARGLRSIEDLDATLTNKDRIKRLIAKEKLTRFPFGGDIEGVMFEWRMRHQDPETAYIRKIVTTAFGSIIIGLYDEQAQIFIQRSTFQMDMSFKRLDGKWNEILFACFDDRHGKIITLGRIITDTQRSKMYELAFNWFFELLGERSRKKVQWYHLNIDGFLGTTVDMDSKQMAGE
ncbi:hypothetical protein EJ02DRAFT_175475 [Clathrospora elynae]|uniref:Uncharacterized protein n=1 Tax=Clathrospora elynae TaxID=706981 RepID=A0A6A5SNU3_9PLEO|nr:hypothetical protein EJ02DRAFT_175475 [Clathrospora elynae]